MKFEQKRQEQTYSLEEFSCCSLKVCYSLSMVQKVLIILNLVVALLGAGIVFYSHTMIKPVPTDQNLEAEALKQNALSNTQVSTVPLKKFVINLHSSATGLRYLELEMNVLPFSNDQQEIIKSSEHIFKDAVIDITSYLDPDDFNSVPGKILL